MPARAVGRQIGEPGDSPGAVGQPAEGLVGHVHQVGSGVVAVLDSQHAIPPGLVVAQRCLPMDFHATVHSGADVSTGVEVVLVKAAEGKIAGKDPFGVFLVGKGFVMVGLGAVGKEVHVGKFAGGQLLQQRGHLEEPRQVRRLRLVLHIVSHHRGIVPVFLHHGENVLAPLLHVGIPPIPVAHGVSVGVEDLQPRRPRRLDLPVRGGKARNAEATLLHFLVKGNIILPRPRTPQPPPGHDGEGLLRQEAQGKKQKKGKKDSFHGIQQNKEGKDRQKKNERQKTKDKTKTAPRKKAKARDASTATRARPPTGDRGKRRRGNCSPASSKASPPA